ncbi:pyridoxamine 5'-phosphate oxidase-like protein [Streptomyces sp. 846.5]|nr:pyridoxamine 5'-phosphate oxidase family protein [Streptomyces sp. 846.5]TDT97404.1 pyridoxamine 5'-phosphate oxidase-like protein [Streptomyces sp. 846.5]
MTAHREAAQNSAAAHHAPVPATVRGGRTTRALDSAEALRLLGSVGLGRIVFTQSALPAIRPVNHIIDNGDIVIRTHEGAALTLVTEQAGETGVVVAYEADKIDPDTHLGWSVVVTGYARRVTDPPSLAHYQRLLEPWVDQAMDYAVCIHPEIITGFRLAESTSPLD